jgi:hypothetical protein
MKKAILSMTLLIFGISFSALAAEKTPGTTSITTIIINADVTVVLTNNDNQAVNMIGDEMFMKFVTFRQEGDKLVVAAQKNRDYKSRGIIYVPSSALQSISINSDATVRSSYVLNLPELRVAINGACRIHLYTTGKVKLEDNQQYEVDYRVRDILPPGYIAINAN